MAGAPLRNAFPGPWTLPVAWLSDVLALLAVVFGLGATLALGARQLAAGLETTTGVSFSTTMTMALLWIVLCAAIASASTNLRHGIRWLSNGNLALMIAIMITVFAVGPTRYIIESGLLASTDYVSQMAALSTRTNNFTSNANWFQSESLTYFLWWLSWAPFVGIFVARISRGRTVREFVAGVLLVPTFFSLCSFVVFGATGFHEVLVGNAEAAVAAAEPAAAIFALFEPLPFSSMLQAATVVTVFAFIVTSVDSGTFVLGMLSSGGSLEPPLHRKIVWGVGLGILSTVFLLAGDVQLVLAMAMSGAVPFALVMLLQACALLRAMYLDTGLERATRDEQAKLVPVARD